MNNNSLLDNKNTLFVLLTSLVKRDGGNIRISEEEIESVSKSDIVRLFYDKDASEIVLSLHDFGENENDNVNQLH